MTLVETLHRFRMVYMDHRSVSDTKNDFYCGITDDLSGCNMKCSADEVLDSVQMESNDMARVLESMMHYDGFDTGRHLEVRSEDCKVVYMFKKRSK